MSGDPIGDLARDSRIVSFITDMLRSDLRHGLRGEGERIARKNGLPPSALTSFVRAFSKEKTVDQIYQEIVSHGAEQEQAEEVVPSGPFEGPIPLSAVRKKDGPGTFGGPPRVP